MKLTSLLLLLSSASVLLASDVFLTPSSLGDWSFVSTDSNGIPCLGCNSGSVVFGPGTPPIGNGSANLQTVSGGGDGAESFLNPDYDGTLISALTSLSYSTYDTANNGSQFPYLEIYINTAGGSTWDSANGDKLFFEPPYQTPSAGSSSCPDQGATAMTTWQTWDALGGCWWDDNGNANPGTGVLPFSTFLTAFPNATIVSDPNGNGGIHFTVGYASPSDNFDGNITNITIGVNGADTTFGFTVAPEPGSVGMCLAGFTALWLARGARRKRLL